MNDDSTPEWLDRFNAKVRVTEDHWYWTAAKNHEGYGFFRLGNRMRLAHRLSYELAHGHLDDSQRLDHICRIRECVNPAHLRPVTQKQNNENQGVRSDSKSGVRGVTWHPKRQRWYAQVGHNNKVISVGYFKDLDTAAAAVKAKRLELYTHNEDDRNES